jgi:hypothetical protein
MCEKAEIKYIKLQKNRKILMTTVLPGGLFEYTWRPIFVSASVHVGGTLPLLLLVKVMQFLRQKLGR